MSVLVGMQPQFRQTPPISSFSITMTRAPRWAARIDDSPFFTDWRAATASPVSQSLERLASPDGKPLLYGASAPPEVPIEDFPSIMTEGDANTTRDLQWQFEQMLNDAAYRGSDSIVLGANDKPVLKPAFVFNRGNQHDPGDAVGRCFPSVLANACFPNASGRLDLANAITACDDNAVSLPSNTRNASSTADSLV